MALTKRACFYAIAAMLLLLFCFPGEGKAQYQVKGMIRDSTEGGMQNAAVAALRSGDSIMVRFTRADAQGHFSLLLPDSGKYILLVTYPNYGDLVLDQDIRQPAVDMGSLSLIPKSKLLEELIVRQKVAAVHMKGDTTEFTADSFHVQPNASVEDLLKQMPGIQVDKNGNIKAQGQTIKKVLVDGEEFFGDDPTLVTKNLRADMVDKV